MAQTPPPHESAALTWVSIAVTVLTFLAVGLMFTPGHGL